LIPELVILPPTIQDFNLPCHDDYTTLHVARCRTLFPGKGRSVGLLKKYWFFFLFFLMTQQEDLLTDELDV
jgi:hypothetical protein